MSQTKAQLISDLVQALNFTGTASAPANGLFLSAANTLKLATASTERLKIDGTELVVNDTGASVDFRVEGDTEANLLFVDASTDRIGIGTNSPSSPLEVSSATNPVIKATSSSSSVGAGFFAQGGSSNDSQFQLNSGTTAKYTFLRDGSQSDDLRIYDSANALDIIRYRHGSYLHFGVNGSERLRIDSSGNVGIGTTTIGEKLTLGDGDLKFFHSNAANAHRTTFIEFGNSSNRIISEMNYGSDSSSNYTAGYKFSTKNYNGSAFENLTPFVIQANGNVGIGTTSPSNLLHVRQEINATGSGTAILQIENTRINTGTGAAALAFRTNEITSGASYLRAQIAAEYDGASNVSGRLLFHTVNSSGSFQEVMRLDDSGNVGIGTKSTSDKLHVRGASAAFTTFILDNATNSSSPYKITFGDQGQVNHLAVANRELTFGTNNAERMRIDSSGRLLLGTTTGGEGTADDFTIAGSGHVGMTIRSENSSECNIFFADGTSGNARFRGMVRYFHNSDALAFNTSAVERLRIDSSGNVGIGTSTIGNESEHKKLIISGASGTGAGILEFQDTSNNTDAALFSDDGNLFIVADRDNTTSSSSIRFRVDGSSEKMRIDSSGNVGIGGTAPNYQLHVVSSIGVGSHGFAQQLSISNQRIQSLLLGTGYRTLMINGLGGDIVMGSGSTQRLAFGTNDGVKYSGFGPAHGAAQDVGLNFYTTTNAGTTFVNHFRIDHNGDLLGTDTNGVSSISDSRVKTDITDYTYDVEKFKQFAPKQFNWKNPEYHGEKTNVKGFLAQDLEAIDTQWVGSSFIEKDHPDYDLVDKSKNSQDEDVGVAKTSKFGGKDAMYISVINQMITKIETLETKVAALEAA